MVISQINTARDFLRDRYDEVMPYLRAKAPDVFDHRNTLESFKRSCVTTRNNDNPPDGPVQCPATEALRWLTQLERGPCLAYGRYFSVASRAFDLAMPDEEDEVRVVGRSIPPPWGTIRFRLALRTHAPRGCIVRVVPDRLTKSRNVNTHTQF